MARKSTNSGMQFDAFEVLGELRGAIKALQVIKALQGMVLRSKELSVIDAVEQKPDTFERGRYEGRAEMAGEILSVLAKM